MAIWFSEINIRKYMLCNGNSKFAVIMFIQFMKETKECAHTSQLACSFEIQIVFPEKSFIFKSIT